MPHMTGGLLPPGLVTVNVSVRHCDAEATFWPCPVATVCPFRIVFVVSVEVEGPVIEKVLKSKRS